MAKKRGDLNISLDEVRRALERSLDGADAARAKGLEGLHRVRAVKANALDREHARLTAKYGAEDERLGAVAQRVEVNRRLVEQVSAEAERAAIDPPAPDPASWTLHGRVLDAALKGLPALTVALYSEKGEWLRQAGFACTDKVGYFRLTVKTLDKGATDDQKPGHEETSRKQASVFIRVLDAKRATLHTDPHPVTPALGRVDFRQIVLGERPADCTPPEGGKPRPKPGTVEKDETSDKPDTAPGGGGGRRRRASGPR